ncbi:MAG: ATPase, T2SS/T4P/T4SS family [bacterium]
MNDTFSQLDFGALKEFLEAENVTDISYTGHGQVWVKTLDKGVYRVERPEINDALMEKLAFQCSNTMGTSFNMAHPLLDAESAELRMNFVHDSISTNGVSCTIRKTPAKIRLNKDKLLSEEYVMEELHDFLLKCVEGHCNIIVSGETGSGKTELVKYLTAATKENEKIITIEDTLELHLDKIFPTRDIVAMKTNNVASYSDVLVACMRQNPRWILLSEVRTAESVTAVRNSISSGHNIISTIHSDRAKNVPMRLYSLMENNIDIDQFLKSIHRYVQVAVHVKGYYSKEKERFQREIVEICEFYVSDDNFACDNVIYKKNLDGNYSLKNPTSYLFDYLASQGVNLETNLFVEREMTENGGSSTKETSPVEKIEVKEEVQQAVAPVVEQSVAPSVPTVTQPIVQSVAQQQVAQPTMPVAAQPVVQQVAQSTVQPTVQGLGQVPMQPRPLEEL